MVVYLGSSICYTPLRWHFPGPEAKTFHSFCLMTLGPAMDSLFLLCKSIVSQITYLCRCQYVSVTYCMTWNYSGISTCLRVGLWWSDMSPAPLHLQALHGKLVPPVTHRHSGGQKWPARHGKRSREKAHLLVSNYLHIQYTYKLALFKIYLLLYIYKCSICISACRPEEDISTTDGCEPNVDAGNWTQNFWKNSQWS